MCVCILFCVNYFKFKKQLVPKIEVFRVIKAWNSHVFNKGEWVNLLQYNDKMIVAFLYFYFLQVSKTQTSPYDLNKISVHNHWDHIRQVKTKITIQQKSNPRHGYWVRTVTFSNGVVKQLFCFIDCTANIFRQQVDLWIVWVTSISDVMKNISFIFKCLDD